MSIPSVASAAAVEIPDHTLLRVIGRGSYGEVWLARNVMGTHRAVKIVRRAAFDSDRPYLREFEGIRRCEPISRAHEGLIDILHMGRHDDEGFFYYVMELADAAEGALVVANYRPVTLADRIGHGPRHEAVECLRIAESLAGALAFLHEQGLIHRDVKPANVLFVGGVPKLGDIGLVAEAGSSRSFVGTEGFVPLEGPGTERADIYALGKVLYEALTGMDRTKFPLLPPDWSSSYDLDQRIELNEIVLRACEGRADGRYSSARELLADVALAASGRSVRKLRGMEARLRLMKWVASLVAVLAALAGAAGWLWRREHTRSEALETARRQAAAATVHAESVSAQLRDANLRLEHALDTAQLDRAEDLFRGGDSGDALAMLARVIERNPAHPVAVPRLASAFWQGSFALPLTPPWQTSGKIVHVQLLRDGRTLLICSTTAITTWDSTGGKLLEFETNGSEFDAAVLSPDESTVLAWDSAPGKSLSVFDTTTGRLRASPVPHQAMLLSVSFPQDSGRFVAGPGIFDARSGQPVGAPIPETGNQCDPVFSPDGETIATSADGIVRLWESLPWKVRIEFPTPGLVAKLLRFSPDGQLLLVSCSDGAMRIYSTADGGPAGPVMRHHDSLRAAVFSEGGTRLLTASTDHTARLWSVPGGEPLTPPMPHRDTVNFAAFSPDERCVVTCSRDHTTRVWDARTGRALTQPLRHSEQAAAAAFSPDGTVLFAGGRDGVVRRWDLRTVESLNARLPGASADFSPDGQRIIAAKTLGVWDSNTLQEIEVAAGLAGESNQVHFSPKGQRAAIAGGGRVTFVPLDPSCGEPPVVIAAGGEIVDFTFSSDGTRIATALQNGSACLWEVATGKAAAPTLAHPAPVAVVRFSPNGTKLLTATRSPPHAPTREHAAQLWDAVTGQPLGHPMKHLDDVNAVEFSPDGTLIATAGKDNTGRVWDAETGSAVSPPLRHARTLTGVAFSPDSRRVATASLDGTARLWEARTGAPIGSPLRHDDCVSDVRFSPDGRRVASASLDRTARLWDAATGQPLTEPLHLDAPGTQVRFHPDGQRIVASTAGGSVHVLDVPDFSLPSPAWLQELAAVLSVEGLPSEPESVAALIARYDLARTAAIASRSDGVYGRLVQRLFPANGQGR